MNGNADYAMANDHMVISDCLEKLGLSDFAKEAGFTMDAKTLSKLVNMIIYMAVLHGNEEVLEAMYFAGFIY